MIRRAPAWMLLAAVLLPGCRTPSPLLPLPPSDARPAALVSAWMERAEGRHALRGVARLALDGPAGSGRAKQLLVAERPARLRVEVLGFLNQTLAVLVTDGVHYRLFRSQDRSLEEGPVHPALLEQVAGVRLRPEEAVDVLLGVPPPAPRARVLAGLLLPDGGIRAELGSGPDEGTRSLEFDTEGRLRRFEVRDPAGATLWEARFDDYRALGEEPFAHTIELRFPATGTRAELSFRDVELNPELPADVFVLRVPSPEGAHAGGRG